jgi:hypothetical protein
MNLLFVRNRRAAYRGQTSAMPSSQATVRTQASDECQPIAVLADAELLKSDVNRKEKSCPTRRAKIGLPASGRFWREADLVLSTWSLRIINHTEPS